MSLLLPTPSIAASVSLAVVVLASLYTLPRYGGHVLERFHLFGHGRSDN